MNLMNFVLRSNFYIDYLNMFLRVFWRSYSLKPVLKKPTNLTKKADAMEAFVSKVAGLLQGGLFKLTS